MGSIACALSHHTVAFCFRINVTYEVGLFVATDLPDVDLRGMLACEPIVPCLCIAAGDCVELLEDTEGLLLCWIEGIVVFEVVVEGTRK